MKLLAMLTAVLTVPAMLMLAPAAQARVLTLRPAQAASLVYYGNDARAEAYAHRGALVVTGRGNYNDRVFRDISRARGTVLVYLDPLVRSVSGHYDALLYNRSACGPAVHRWGRYPVADFRVGGIEQRKLRCVLERMVAGSPQMAGWFADDLGSMSWFPGMPWRSVPARDKRAYRAGSIALARTFRSVADKHHLIFIVNGTWGAGSLGSAGGGYPYMNRPGLSLADGGFVEHHDGELSYFGPYACSRQWASASRVTRGHAVNYAIVNTVAARNAYARSCYAFVNIQTSYDYARPWGRFHATGLPSGR